MFKNKNMYKNLTIIEKPINVEDLFPLVEKECKLIKENFTQKEIDNLFDEDEGINPNSTTDCIYGKMTGDCNSARVLNFIQNNISIVVKTDYKREGPIEELTPEEKRSYFFMTPLEEFIYNPDTQNEEEVEASQNRIERVLDLLQ